MSVVAFVHPKTLARHPRRGVALGAIMPRLQRLRHLARSCKPGDVINEETGMITTVSSDVVTVKDLSIVFCDTDDGTIFRISPKAGGKLLMSGYLRYNEQPHVKNVMGWKRGEWEERLF